MTIRPRRRPAPRPLVPARLLDFDPREWPGDPDDAFTAWKAARRAFAEAHGDAPLGDAVDRIRFEMHARRSLFLREY